MLLRALTVSLCSLGLMILPACAQTPLLTPQQVEAEGARQQAIYQARVQSRNRPVSWWPQTAQKPDSWFAGSEGLAMAANILSWQDPVSGGWPLMNTTRELKSADPAAIGPWGERGALIKATVNEVRFLARAYKATGNADYLASLDRGIDFILKAQYPSGGWPHSWPEYRNPYDHWATFNDDEMVDLMTLLHEVATSDAFDFLPQARREVTRDAFDRGVDFILKSQIRVDGKLTAWCAQHDPVTYEPRPARAFEPVSISGGESAGVLRLLMQIKDPSPEVVAAIENGIAWYLSVQIRGIRVEVADGDRIVHQDASAEPLWARFYEIGTNRPIFSGRDGVIKYSLAEIEKERRGGYAWYGVWGRDVLTDYANWQRTRQDS